LIQRWEATVTDKMVTLTLAHPLQEKGARRVRAKVVKDYKAGEKITVPHHEVKGIKSAGYAVLDPEDEEQAAETPGAASPAAKSSGGKTA
jgi:hypothetical protein